MGAATVCSDDVKRRESKLSLQESLQRRRQEEGVEVESPYKSHCNDDNKETRRELTRALRRCREKRVRQLTMYGR